MEIEKAALTDIQHNTVSKVLKEGDFLRVRVLKSLKYHNYLVEFKGNTHLARLKGFLTSRLFIAKVLKLSPKIELQFVKDLENGASSINHRVLEKLLLGKKPFIQKMIVSDNFFEGLSIFIQKDKKDIKASLRKSVAKQTVLGLATNNREVVEYFILQNIYNLFNFQSSYILLPVLLGRKKSFCELKVIGDRDSQGTGFILNVHLENERKIIFIVFIDYELISCSLSTNDAYIEGELEKGITLLAGSLKSLYYDRKIDIRIVPYNEKGFQNLHSIKKIDIKM